MKKTTYQNDELLKRLFKKMTLESPSVGFSERVLDLIIQPEVDMSAHQQTINKLLWTVIASVALLIPVLFFLLDWSIFDLFPSSISVENFKHLVVFLGSLPDYFSSVLSGIKQYSLLFIITGAGVVLLIIDSFLSKSLLRSLFPFNFAGHNAK
ncbi:MAG: hypothetical protein Q8908_09000 [Bacteroidota bacterium]|nr:hypothetical protein [Bacteroidota bacterium]